MRFAIIGCGYVFDHYMETLGDHAGLELAGVADCDADRLETVARYHGVPVYPSNEAVLADESVSLVVNLTDPDSHYEVTRACLEAGKHVYSEKPLATRLEQAVELVDLAERLGLTLSSAPCSALSEAAQTLWKAVLDGAVGRPKLVYAELDDNPVYRMRPEGWTNESGAPWPYRNEYEVGCTLEHAGYYLTWLVAMFGPARTVTAFSSCVVPDKAPEPLDRPDTPDLSVGCIVFESGVVARLTCSIVAPYDHRLRIIGDEGVLSVDECWQYAAPVSLERFSQVSLNARKSRTVRGSRTLRGLFGVGGRRQRLAVEPRSQVGDRWSELRQRRRPAGRVAVKAISRRELVSMDFFRGVAEMADAIDHGRQPLLSARFSLHVLELALAMQGAGEHADSHRLTTTFEPLEPLAATLASGRSYGESPPPLFSRLADPVIARLHRH